MHFSRKIKQFYHGIQVYEQLIEDEKAIHIPFALSFTIAFDEDRMVEILKNCDMSLVIKVME